jgi:hypothetical protein
MGRAGGGREKLGRRFRWMVLKHELAWCRRGGLIIASDLISRPRDIDRHRLPRPGRLAIALESAYRRRFAWRLADVDCCGGVQAGCPNGFGNASQSQTSSTGSSMVRVPAVDVETHGPVESDLEYISLLNFRGAECRSRRGRSVAKGGWGKKNLRFLECCCYFSVSVQPGCRKGSISKIAFNYWDLSGKKGSGKCSMWEVLEFDFSSSRFGKDVSSRFSVPLWLSSTSLRPASAYQTTGDNGTLHFPRLQQQQRLKR